MQVVSQKWKNQQRKTLVPEAFLEIIVKIVDPEAQADASVVTNGSEFFATPEEITGDNVAPVKYAMLEPGLWVLDGTYRIIGGDWEPSEPIGPNTGVVGYAVVGTAIVGKDMTG